MLQSTVMVGLPSGKIAQFENNLKLQAEADALREEAVMAAAEAKRQEAISIQLQAELEGCKDN